jgi:hypothetical protein
VVCLELSLRAVAGVAIELDDETLLVPDRVDEPPCR